MESAIQYCLNPEPFLLYCIHKVKGTNTYTNFLSLHDLLYSEQKVNHNSLQTSLGKPVIWSPHFFSSPEAMYLTVKTVRWKTVSGGMPWCHTLKLCLKVHAHIVSSSSPCVCCINYFSQCCDQVPDKKQTNGKGMVSELSLGCGDRNMMLIACI